MSIHRSDADRVRAGEEDHVAIERQLAKIHVIGVSGAGDVDRRHALRRLVHDRQRGAGGFLDATDQFRHAACNLRRCVCGNHDGGLRLPILHDGHRCATGDHLSERYHCHDRNYCSHTFLLVAPVIETLTLSPAVGSGAGHRSRRLFRPGSCAPRSPSGSSALLQVARSHPSPSRPCARRPAPV